MALMFPNIVAVPSCAKRHGKRGISGGGRVSGREPLLEPWHARMAQKAVKAKPAAALRNVLDCTRRERSWVVCKLQVGLPRTHPSMC